ncbi:MAG: hypothetical protein KGO21_12605 [Hyphomicrobiales bacterium]|nr:hypothetical protein [Hyphomicrobiales bacterium]
MLLKDFPEGFSLGYSVHVLSLMLQSILIRTGERVDARGFSEEEARAFDVLVDLLHAALRDAAQLQKRMGH